jgi:hypothetical protein
MKSPVKPMKHRETQCHFDTQSEANSDNQHNQKGYECSVSWLSCAVHSNARPASVIVILNAKKRRSLSKTVRPCLVSRQDLFCCINPQKQGRWLGTRMVDERATFAAEVGSDRGANGCLNEPFQLKKVTGVSLAQRQKVEPGPADH